MSVYTIRLIWKHNSEDIKLGTCYSTIRPMTDELISYSSDLGTTWKVILVYHQPFMADSVVWNSWRNYGQHPDSIIECWVEPAEGPWE